MELDEINELVRRVIDEIQVGSGRTMIEMDDNLQPIGDLEGFDSLNAVEASCLLTEYLECDIPSEIMLSPNPERQLTINEITERLHNFINATGG